MLEAAAPALQLTEAGIITPHGSLGPLLQAELYRPTGDGASDPAYPTVRTATGTFSD
jgi:hypothetical protein